MTRRSYVALGALALLSAGAGPNSPAASQQKPKTHTVAVESMRFSPARLTVTRGDSIVWVNKDIVAHTATSKAAGLESGTIPPEKSWKTVLQKRGTVEYLCRFHPTMTGTIEVK